jgi:hypothetical protein
MQDSMITTLVPGSNLDNIFVDHPDTKMFIFPPGDYYITKILRIDQNNIFFTGYSREASDVHIWQQTPDKDGIVIQNVNHVFIRFISIHVTGSNKIALNVSNSHDINIEYNNFFGNKDYFTIFFSGPIVSAGENTILAYETSALDSNNCFMNNIIYSSWSGDNVSISLQINCRVFNNIIRGGRLAIYMCRDTFILGNTIFDSTTEGVFVSLPSHNINIDSNTIYECASSAIKVSNQVEHGIFTHTPYNIHVNKNTIYDAHHNGIEMNDAEMVFITENNLVGTDNFASYFLSCSNIHLTNNLLSYFIEGVWAENSHDIFVENNKFNSVYPDNAAHGVWSNDISSNITVTNNSFNGQYTTNEIIDVKTETKTIENNTITKWYNYWDDRALLKH